METQFGVIENIKPGHCYVRAETDWTRYFVAGSDMDGPIPAQWSRVEFVADHSDVRGPRARHVRTWADPPPPLNRYCRDCSTVFVLDAGTQLWFESKSLNLPVRCEPCRKARRQAAGG